jgi:hypothetical protein
MRDARDRRRSDPGVFPNGPDIDGEETVVLDFSGPHWQIIDHQPERKRRGRGGCDPYNSAEQPPRRHAWLRIERR